MIQIGIVKETKKNFKNRQMLFNYFDIIILVVIVITDLLIWKYRPIKKLDWKLLTVVFLLLFIVVPYISTKIEQYQVHQTEEMIDGFNLLYIFFKYPIWWTIGIIEIMTIRRLIKKKTHHNST